MTAYLKGEGSPALFLQCISPQVARSVSAGSPRLWLLPDEQRTRCGRKLRESRLTSNPKRTLPLSPYATYDPIICRKKLEKSMNCRGVYGSTKWRCGVATFGLSVRAVKP